MHAIESIRTDIYEQCLNEALNYSANSGHIVRATLTGLAEALLKLSNHRQFGLQGVKALLLECFDKYWKQLAAVLGEQSINALPLTRRDSSVVHELLHDRSRLIAALKPYSNQLRQLTANKQRIHDQMKLCEDPTVYYNVHEQQRAYGELERLYEQYNADRPANEEMMRTANRILAELTKINRKLCSQGEQTLRSCNESMGRTAKFLEERFSNMLVVVGGILHRFVGQLQHGDVESSLAIDKEEFRRHYLHNLSRTSHTTNQDLNGIFGHTVKAVRRIMDGLESRSRFLNETLNEYFAKADGSLALAKKHLKDHLEKLLSVKLFAQFENLCFNSRLLQRALRSAEQILAQFLELSRDALRVGTFQLKELNARTSARYQTAFLKVNNILDGYRQPDVRQLFDLHNALYQELETLQNIENSDNRQFRCIMVKVLEKYGHDVDRTCRQLKEQRIRSSPAINLYEYIRNEMLADILTQPLVWDSHFETKVGQTINQRLQISVPEEITAAGDGSYSCALGGKLLLSGRMKVCEGTLCFESSFNKRNLFFGGTKLIVPKSHLIGVRLETMMMLPNSLEVQTKMGPLFFTSLFHRGQAMKDIEEMMNSAPDRDYNTEEADNESVKSEELSAEEVQLVLNRERSIDVKMFDPLEVQTIKTQFKDVNLKTFYRLILSDAEARTQGKCFQNFRVMMIKKEGNSEVKCSKLEPQPPGYFEKGGDIKLSQALPSEREVTYKRKLPSLPIPFMPSHSNCREKEKIHWVSQKKMVVEKENSATGIPFADSFFVRQKMVLIETSETTVQCTLSYEIIFKPGASLQGVLRGAAEKQINSFEPKLVKEIENYLTEVRARPKHRRSRRLSVDNAADNSFHEEAVEPTKMKHPLRDTRIQLIIAAALLAFVLIILGQFFQ